MIDEYKFDDSQRAVLYGLQVIMKRDVGIGKPISPSTLFISYLREAGVFEELDFADVFYEVDALFEVKIPFSEWDTILVGAHRKPADWEKNVAKVLTFGHIATFIAVRLPITKVSPATILGKQCAQAGAFRTIEHFVDRIDSEGEQFGPSTPIRQRLRGAKLKRVWTQLSWLSEGRLPSLRTPPSEAVRNWLFWKMFLVFGVALVAKFLFWLDEERFGEFLGICTYVSLAMIGVVVGVSAIVWAISPVLNRIESRLPSGFKTFRDMAVAMAPVN